MLKRIIWSLIAPLHIEVFQRNLACSLQMPWSARTPKRIKIRRLKNEIFALAEIAKLVFGFVFFLLLLLFFRHFYTTLSTDQTICPTELVIVSFQRYIFRVKDTYNIQGGAFSINRGNRPSSSSYTGVCKPRHDGKYCLNHCSNSNNNSTTESTTKKIEARAAGKQGRLKWCTRSTYSLEPTTKSRHVHWLPHAGGDFLLFSGYYTPDKESRLP